MTKRVQPYCRLAIITMQMMPKISWPQRVLSEASAGVWTADVSVLTRSSLRGAPLRPDGNFFATANASFTLCNEPFKNTVTLHYELCNATMSRLGLVSGLAGGSFFFLQPS